MHMRLPYEKYITAPLLLFVGGGGDGAVTGWWFNIYVFLEGLVLGR